MGYGRGGGGGGGSGGSGGGGWRLHYSRRWKCLRWKFKSSTTEGIGGPPPTRTVNTMLSSY